MAKFDLDVMELKTKWWLLIVSAVTLVLLIASALRENVFEEWRHIRKDYARILEAKATDDRGRAIAEQFEIGIDQVVVPDLGIIDRCITCHTGLDDPRMADQEQPYRTHPGGLLSNHPPEQFGCTLCHQGQGRATDAGDAHGRVEYWPSPMYEKQYMYSACSRCHDANALFGADRPAALDDSTPAASEAVQGALLVAEGKRLFDESGCLGCHILNGRGGTLGPDITFVGDKTRHDFDFTHFGPDEPREPAYWLNKHFLEPQGISPGTLMPNMGLTADQAQALTAYALSLKKPRVPREYEAPAPASHAGLAPDSGEKLYKMMCVACHGPDGRESDVPGIRSPALNNFDTQAVASDNFFRFIIAQGRSNTSMPAWGPGSKNMSNDEIDRVVSYIRGWQPEGADLAEISSKVGNAAFGRAYYQGFCANCHGPEGQGGIGNALNSQTFLGVASDRFLAETIVQGRPGTAMASWKHLPEQAVSDILAYIRSWQATAPAWDEVKRVLASGNPEEDARVGALLFKGNCAVCHGRDGEGGIGPRLNSLDIVPSVDDEFLYRTIAHGRPATAMPAWRHLSADRIAALIAYMRSWNGARTFDLPGAAPSRGDYALGEVHYRLSCLACHGEDARGGVGPRLSSPAFLSAVSDDVLYNWIAHGRTGTAMKGFLNVEQGLTTLTREQIGDVIAYLRFTGSRAERPILRTGIGNPLVGGQVFQGTCSGCHGRHGEGASGPQLNNETFLRTASDGFLLATITLGRDGTAMRSMTRGLDGVGQIDPNQVQDVIAYMRLWDVPQSWQRPRPIAELSERAIASGAQKFIRFCSGCHGPNGLGQQEAEGADYFAPALNNREFLSAASDGYLLATIARGRSNTPMRPFGQGAGGIASLGAGDIGDIVSYIRTWEEAYKAKGD